MTARGNFEDPHAHDPSVRRTVLSEVMSLDDLARQLSLSIDAAREALDRAKAKMFERREKRPRPFRDEKVLAGWNGLAIGACAEVAMATGDARARTMAERAFAAVEAKLIAPSEKLAAAAVSRGCPLDRHLHVVADKLERAVRVRTVEPLTPETGWGGSRH